MVEETRKRAKPPSWKQPRVVDVTPELAAEWLELNTHNRELRQNKVDQYCRDMEQDNWHLTHQGIAFNCIGTLIDGQHRLWAVIESGKTVPMLVVCGLPIESQLVIDDHCVRLPKDYLTLTDKYGRVTGQCSGTLIRMLQGVAPRRPDLSHVELEEMFEKYKPAVDFSIGCFTNNKARLTSSVVRAVIARAWYSKFEKSEIVEFCEILLSGMAPRKARNKTPLCLRNTLVTGERGKPHHARRVYLLTQVALDAFLLDRGLKLIRPTERELFMLPGEEDGGWTRSRGHGGRLLLSVVKFVNKKGRATKGTVSAAFDGMTKHGAYLNMERAVGLGMLSVVERGEVGKHNKPTVYGPRGLQS